jgi:hypothetical protein
MNAIEAIIRTGLAASRSEAIRKVKEGAVKVVQEITVRDAKAEIGDIREVSVGRNRKSLRVIAGNVIVGNSDGIACSGSRIVGNTITHVPTDDEITAAINSR